MSAGFDLAKAGAQAAQQRADQALFGTWSERAYAAFLAVARKGEPFQTEDVRVAAAQYGLPDAPDNRAWGAVALRALRESLITRVGYAPVKNPTSHAAPKSVWRIV